MCNVTQLAEKQKKMRDKEAKKEEKRKRIEEEKVRKQLEREEKKKQQKAKKNASNERTRKTGKVTKRNQTRRAKGKQWRQQQCTESTSSAVTNEEDDICNICLQEYFLSDVENNPWVQCGSCKSWMHIYCIPIGLDVGNKPEIEKIPSSLWNHVTDEKRGVRVRTIAGLPIGRVPKGLSSCFYELLGSSNVECIEWYVNQLYSFPFY